MWSSTSRPWQTFTVSGVKGASDQSLPPTAGRPLQHISSPSVSAMLTLLERDAVDEGEWFSSNSYFFNLNIEGRPSSSRGCFSDFGDDRQAVGDLLFVPKGCRFRARGDRGKQQNLFLETTIDPMDEELEEFDPQILGACLNLHAPLVRNSFLRIVEEMETPSFASKLMVEGLGISALGETLRLLRCKSVTARHMGGLSPWRMKLIKERVRHGHGVPSIGELGSLCGLSTRHLMRTFRIEMGQTLGQYIQQQCLERAKERLLDTHLRISEIAFEVGFQSTAAFSTAFRRMTGESPRAFRSGARLRTHN